MNVFEANIRLLGGLLSAHALAIDPSLHLITKGYIYNNEMLNLDCYHNKILTEIEKNEKLLTKYKSILEQLKINLKIEINLDKQLEIKDQINFYTTKIKKIKSAKKDSLLLDCLIVQRTRP